MNRTEALEIVHEYIKTEGLVNHMLSVEAAMRWYARELGQDEHTWGLAGLLHDYDWEVHPISGDHPILGLPLLREKGVSEYYRYSFSKY